MSLRVAGWLGALALVSAWWVTSLGGPEIVRERGRDRADAATTRGRDGSAFTERLRRGLLNAPAAPAPRRNPFLFGTLEPAPPADRSPPTETLPPVAPASAPGFTLAGIATSETPDGSVRTAVLSDAQGIALVKAGDVLPTGLVVVSVGEDHIVLTDAAGTETILRLK